MDQNRWSLRAIHLWEFAVLWFHNMIFVMLSNNPKFFCGKKRVLNRDKFLLSSTSSFFISPHKLILGQMLLLFIFYLGGIFKYRKQFCKLPAASVLLGLCRGPNNLWKNSTCVFTRNGFHNIDEFQMKGIYLIKFKWKENSLSVSRNWLQNPVKNSFVVP